jgi:hypothetical protein
MEPSNRVASISRLPGMAHRAQDLSSQHNPSLELPSYTVRDCFPKPPYEAIDSFPSRSFSVLRTLFSAPSHSGSLERVHKKSSPDHFVVSEDGSDSFTLDPHRLNVLLSSVLNSFLSTLNDRLGRERGLEFESDIGIVKFDDSVFFRGSRSKTIRKNTFVIYTFGLITHSRYEPAIFAIERNLNTGNDKISIKVPLNKVLPFLNKLEFSVNKRLYPCID